MVPEPGRAPRREDPGAGQGPPCQGAHRDGRRQEARVADHDGAVARVRQVPGRDQARHSGRAAEPSLNLNVTDTATIIARVRAAESELPPDVRLFDDPFARLFASELEPHEIADQFA